MSDNSWCLGLKPNEQIPGTLPEMEMLLDEYNGVWRSPTKNKKVYFTFDLGYEAGYTNDVLDVLKENNIQALFFLVSHYLEQNEIVSRMINENHILGNHTDRHKNPVGLSYEEVKKDIEDFEYKFIEKYPEAIPMEWYRPPEGKYDEQTLAVVKEKKLRTMLWSLVLSKDWLREPAYEPQESAEKIMIHIHPGAILLLHIANPSTPEMIKRLIPMLLEKGYEIGNLRDLK